MAGGKAIALGAESSTQCLAGVKRGSCSLTPEDAQVSAAGMLKIENQKMAQWGSLSPRICVGCRAWWLLVQPGLGTEVQRGPAPWLGCERRDGHTVPCPWDPSPSRSQLTAPGPRLPEGSGVHALAAD